MATSIHALWSLDHNESDHFGSKSSVAANGSVISMYPGFQKRCQDYANGLISINLPAQSKARNCSITIQPIDEATILGVAVAVAVQEGLK